MSVRQLLFFIFLFFSVTFTDRTAAEEKEYKVIKVAGDNNFPPFEYLSSTGVYTGFNVDVIQAVSLETGLNIEYYPMPWSDALQALREGRVDMVQGMKYSLARSEVYAFTEPYFTSSQGIFVLKDNVSIHTISDLEQRSLVVQKGDIAYDVVGYLNRAKIIQAENQEQAMQLLLDGTVDAFLGNRMTGQYILQKMNRYDEVKIVGTPIEPTDYAMVVMPHHQI